NWRSPARVGRMIGWNVLCADPYNTSLAEALIKAPNGGAFAVWASSGLREPLSQATANVELYRKLMGPGSTTIGEAIRSAKASVADMDFRRTWILLGDPASRIQPGASLKTANK